MRRPTRPISEVNLGVRESQRSRGLSLRLRPSCLNPYVFQPRWITGRDLAADPPGHHGIEVADPSDIRIADPRFTNAPGTLAQGTSWLLAAQADS
jgi:hypothetical protein